MFSKNIISLSRRLVPVTYFSSTSLPITNTKDTQQIIDTILVKPTKLTIRKALEKDPRYRISRNEYFSLCSNVGLSTNEAEDFLSHLKEATVVYTFPYVKDYIFLKPEQLANHMIDVIDPEYTQAQKRITELQKSLRNKHEQISKLSKIKTKLDKQAEKQASRLLYGGLGIMVGHLTLVARLTWWELSWDIVEPITYMVTYSTATLILIYFCRTKIEYNYESLFHRMSEKRKQKIYKKNQFDISKYNQLEKLIKEHECELEQLHMGIPPHAIHVDSYCNTSHLILPSSSTFRRGKKTLCCIKKKRKKTKLNYQNEQQNEQNNITVIFSPSSFFFFDILLFFKNHY